MALPSELVLVNSILSRAREGKLSWEELSTSGFVTRVGQTLIVVDRVRGDPPTLRVTDSSGKILEEIKISPVSQSAPEMATLLFEIYELARRQALRVDEALSDLQRMLDKL